VPSPARYLDLSSAPLSLPSVLFPPSQDLACHRLSVSQHIDKHILPSQPHRRGGNQREIVSWTCRALTGQWLTTRLADLELSAKIDQEVRLEKESKDPAALPQSCQAYLSSGPFEVWTICAKT
jgi:hypothetical protein